MQTAVYNKDSNIFIIESNHKIMINLGNLRTKRVNLG